MAEVQQRLCHVSFPFPRPVHKTATRHALLSSSSSFSSSFSSSCCFYYSSSSQYAKRLPRLVPTNTDSRHSTFPHRGRHDDSTVAGALVVFATAACAALLNLEPSLSFWFRFAAHTTQSTLLTFRKSSLVLQDMFVMFATLSTCSRVIKRPRIDDTQRDRQRDEECMGWNKNKRTSIEIWGSEKRMVLPWKAGRLGLIQELYPS